MQQRFHPLRSLSHTYLHFQLTIVPKKGPFWNNLLYACTSPHPIISSSAAARQYYSLNYQTGKTSFPISKIDLKILSQLLSSKILIKVPVIPFSISAVSPNPVLSETGVLISLKIGLVCGRQWQCTALWMDSQVFYEWRRSRDPSTSPNWYFPHNCVNILRTGVVVCVCVCSKI